MTKLPVYGFLGKGSTAQRNAELQLDNFMPEDVGEMFLPAGRAGPGIKHVRDWLTDAYGGDNVGESTDVVGALLVDKQAGHDAVLVMVLDDPPDDDDREAVARAIQGGILVKSINHAMDDLSILDVVPETPPSAPEKPAAAQTATRRRRSTTPAADAAEAVSEPPAAPAATRKPRGRARTAPAADPTPPVEQPVANLVHWQGTSEELIALIDARLALALTRAVDFIQPPPF